MEELRSIKRILVKYVLILKAMINYSVFYFIKLFLTKFGVVLFCDLLQLSIIFGSYSKNILTTFMFFESFIYFIRISKLYHSYTIIIEVNVCIGVITGKLYIYIIICFKQYLSYFRMLLYFYCLK